jgi:hypothetical protein
LQINGKKQLDLQNFVFCLRTGLKQIKMKEGVYKIRSNFWSDDHRFVLYHCAKRIRAQFSYLELDELVSECWLHYLRYREKVQPYDIKRCMSNMFNYAKKFI